MTVSDPEESLAALAQIRDVARQRAYISKGRSLPTQALIESISARVRELLPKDPDLAQILAETQYLKCLIKNSQWREPS